MTINYFLYYQKFLKIIIINFPIHLIGLSSLYGSYLVPHWGLKKNTEKKSAYGGSTVDPKQNLMPSVEV